MGQSGQDEQVGTKFKVAEMAYGTIRVCHDPLLTTTQQLKIDKLFYNVVSKLKVTLIPILLDVGMRWKDMGVGDATCLDNLLVDHDLLLGKNGELYEYGMCLSGDDVCNIKVKIQTDREDYCDICKRSFTFLTEEGFVGRSAYIHGPSYM